MSPPGREVGLCQDFDSYEDAEAYVTTGPSPDGVDYHMARKAQLLALRGIEGGTLVDPFPELR